MKAHQVDALNKGFTPSEQELASAKAVLEDEAADPSMSAIASALFEQAEAYRKHDQVKTQVIARAGV